jgi:hypothetical protein
VISNKISETLDAAGLRPEVQKSGVQKYGQDSRIRGAEGSNESAKVRSSVKKNSSAYTPE